LVVAIRLVAVASRAFAGGAIDLATAAAIAYTCRGVILATVATRAAHIQIILLHAATFVTDEIAIIPYAVPSAVTGIKEGGRTRIITGFTIGDRTTVDTCVARVALRASTFSGIPEAGAVVMVTPITSAAV